MTWLVVKDNAVFSRAALRGALGRPGGKARATDYSIKQGLVLKEGFDRHLG
jgi:hypothetical protein